MIQTYRIWLALPDKPTKHYCGLVFADGESAESRVDDELSLRKPPNKDFALAVEEHGRYAFDWEMTGNHDSILDALNFEAAEIEKYQSWHSDHGWNKTRGVDKKRLKRALAEAAPGASESDLLDVAEKEFRANAPVEWLQYDTTENMALLRAYAVKNRPCSIFTAFARAIEADILKIPPVIDCGAF